MGLNKAQKQAVEHTGSPLLITAGPGTGKTLVIKDRIKFLMKSGLKPSEILCLTFSTKAAAELKTRLEQDEEIKGKIDISDIQISTYHAFCQQILFENTMATGLAMNKGIVDRATFLVWGVQNIDLFGFDSYVEIKNNASDIIEKMIDGISVFNDELVSPEELEKYVVKKLSDESITDLDELDTIHKLVNLVKIYKMYTQFKVSHDVMDFDDLIVQTNRLFENKEKEHVLKQVQQKYKHVLIDEFQDNNFAQFSIVRKIVTGWGVTAVGDADQNIYRFQGAYTQIFEDFKKSFPDYTEIFLYENYRNPKNIIELSSELLTQDTYRIPPKPLEAQKDDEQKVRVIDCSSEFAQAEFVKNQIVELMKSNPDYTFSDFAVLSRKQRDGLNTAQILVSEGIPVKYVGKSDLKSSPSAKVLFSWLRIIGNPANSLININGILREYGISEQNISKINREAKTRAWGKTDGDYCFDVLSDLNVPDLTQKTELKEIFQLIQKFTNIAKDNPPSVTIYKIMRNETDIYKKIANDDTVEHFIQRSILNDILESAYDLEKIKSDATIPDFLQFIEHLESFDVETKRGTTDSNSVQVSTIHQSKGLEFQVVFVIDVARGRMPGRFTQKPFYVPDELAKGVKPAAEPKEEYTREERRLLYVAMTRTITHLFISYPTQYENRVRANKASPFLEALDPENNPNVNFLKITSAINASDALTFDAVQLIKNETVEGVIKHVSNSQYASAIKKIIDLATIDHFQINKTTDGFDANNIITLDGSENLKGRLDGTSSTSLKFGQQNLSYSKISSYVDCPKKFWYQNVLDALPENQEAPALYKGGFFHKIVEKSSMKQKDEGKADSLKTLIKQVSENWDPTEYLTRSVQKEQQDKKSLDFALDSYQKWTISNPNTIVNLEMKFSIHVGGYQINGVIDRIEQTPEGDYKIIDYKTGHTTPSKVPDNLQLNIYCMAIQEKFGKLPTRASFFYVEEPEGDQWYHYDVTASHVAEVKQTLEEHIEAISTDNYDADPGFKCKWCDYKDICEEAM